MMAQSQQLDEITIRADTKHLLPDLKEVWQSRELLIILTVRDIKLRYKQTLLGLIWVVLQPLLSALILAVIFGVFVRLDSEGLPFVLFVFSGMLPWNLFSGILSRAGNSVLKDTGLVSKVYFPRVILPLASSLAVVIDFAITLVLMGALMAIYGITPSLNIIFIPLLTIIILMIGVGIALFFSAVSVYYRDFVHVLPFISQIWFYATPIVYSVSVVPARFRSIYTLNPWVGLINTFRWCLFGGEFPWQSFGVAVAISVLILIAGAIVFERIQPNFVDAA